MGRSNQNESFKVFFKDFDGKSQKLLLNKSLWQFLSKGCVYTITETDLELTSLSEREFFVALLNYWKPLRSVTKSSILNVADTLVMPRGNVQKKQFPVYMYFIILRQKRTFSWFVLVFKLKVARSSILSFLNVLEHLTPREFHWHILFLSKNLSYCYIKFLGQ